MSQPRIVLMGPPGAGKGTQSERIVDEYGVEHVTTGDALRANRDMETEHGTPREYMEAGDLVPDPVVNEILSAALADADGFVLDGYPRNVAQAEFLDERADPDVIAVLEVARGELIDRLTGRRICPDCGANYHVDFSPPATAGVCDGCGSDLIQREDDAEATVRNRLDTFDDQTTPVIDYYEGRDAYAEVDGEGTPDEVWDRLRAAIDERV